MKRITLATIALLPFFICFAQLQNELTLPGTVQRFIDEQVDRTRMLKTSNANAAFNYYSQFTPSRMVNGVEMIDAFIDIDNSAVVKTLKANGVEVHCEFDGFVTARVPVAALTRLSHLPGVKDIEISRTVEMCTDSTLKLTNAIQVLNGPDYGLPQAYDGTGVVIGIIDCGFDYQHLAFRYSESDPRTRIVRVYDPENSTGHPVRIGNNVLPGSLFMGEQIDTLTMDTNGTHGTHTASIAAGLHVNGYGGMAPGADIVLCSSRLLNLYTSEEEVVNCIKYIYAYADSVGKPCVISVSVSNRYGPHDGSDRISKVVAQMTGPGHIFVIAAGNEGNNYNYSYGQVTVENPMYTLLRYKEESYDTDWTYYYRDVWVDSWVREKGTRSLIKFHIFDKYQKRIVWESDLIKTYTRITSDQFSQYYEPDLSVDSEGYMYGLVSLSPSSSKYEVQAYIHNLKSKDFYINNKGDYCSRYQIGISFHAPSLAYPRQPDHCYIDSWMVNGQRGPYNDVVYVDVPTEDGDSVTTVAMSYFYHNPSDNCCIGNYAVNDSCISAGAYVGKNYYYSLPDNNNYYDSSVTLGNLYIVSGYQAPGYGPTATHLPTVTAPGFLVVAAASRFSYINNWHRTLVMKKNGYPWGVLSGTSMAAPTVAGIIAQWLQINPNLGPNDVKQIIAETAIKDYYTQNGNFSVRFGPNGKIDAMAGVQYLLSLQEDVVNPGDVNGNGVVNTADISFLIRHLLGEDVIDFNAANADVDQDGHLSVKDIATLIQMLLHEEEEEEEEE